MIELGKRYAIGTKAAWKSGSCLIGVPVAQVMDSGMLYYLVVMDYSWVKNLKFRGRVEELVGEPWGDEALSQYVCERAARGIFDIGGFKCEKDFQGPAEEYIKHREHMKKLLEEIYSSAE